MRGALVFGFLVRYLHPNSGNTLVAGTREATMPTLTASALDPPVQKVL